MCWWEIPHWKQFSIRQKIFPTLSFSFYRNFITNASQFRVDLFAFNQLKKSVEKKISEKFVVLVKICVFNVDLKNCKRMNTSKLKAFHLSNIIYMLKSLESNENLIKHQIELQNRIFFLLFHSPSLSLSKNIPYSVQARRREKNITQSLECESRKKKKI